MTDSVFLHGPDAAGSQHALIAGVVLPELREQRMPKLNGEAFEMVPVALVTMTGCKFYPECFDLTDDTDWSALRGRVLEAFDAEAIPPHGVDVRFDVMERGALDRLEEHQGW